MSPFSDRSHVPTAEVDRAEEAGIVRSRNVGRTRLITANTRSFAYEPLGELLLRARSVRSRS